MTIPKTFRLMGKTWTVKHDPVVLAKNEEYGRCIYSEETIIIHAPENHDKQTRQGREHTFCHELVHAIASSACVELEEHQVNVMAGLLHQFIETQEGNMP